MTATQTLKMYQILQKHFKSDEEASTVVKQIEELVDIKIDQRKEILATKEDVTSVRQDLLKLQIDIEKRLNQMTIWIVSTGIAGIGIIFALIKLK